MSMQVEKTYAQVNSDQYLRIQQFIYREARLADDSQYKDWESLWDTEGTYWIPVGDGKYNPDEEVSIVHDNRARIGSRIRQLESGRRYAQVPASVMRRTVSNIEVERFADGEYRVHANFMMLELPLQSCKELRLWGGRVEYVLRERGEDLKIGYKKVLLVNASGPIANLPFLI